MEDILLNRLSIYIKEIRSLSEQALNLCNTLNEDNLEKARVATAKLKSILSRFTAELNNYFNICKNPDADEISNFTTYQLKGEEVWAELEIKIKLKSEHPTTSTKESEPPAYSKLPDLNLPEFSGNLLEWHQFWDQFTSNINRRKLNDVDKLLYLKSSLKGDAARLVDGLDTTNKNYEIAVNTLKARYGKEKEIIYAHHKALNKIKRAEKMEDCRGTLDEIERHLRVLQSIGENISTNHVRFLLLEKFPTEIIYETKMRLGSDGTESVEDIRKQLSIIISAKEEAQRMTHEITPNEELQFTVETLHVKENTQFDKQNDFKKKNYDNMKPRWNQGKNTKPGQSNWNSNQENRPVKRKFWQNKENIGKSNGEKRRKWSCIFCGENHVNVYCENIKTVEERKEKLKDRCFNCFKKEHRVRHCQLKSNCKNCGTKGFRHHRALCPKIFQKKVEKGEEPTSVIQ